MIDPSAGMSAGMLDTQAQNMSSGAEGEPTFEDFMLLFMQDYVLEYVTEDDE